jgi:hypothetical protein
LATQILTKGSAAREDDFAQQAFAFHHLRTAALARADAVYRNSDELDAALFELAQAMANFAARSATGTSATTFVDVDQGA